MCVRMREFNLYHFRFSSNCPNRFEFLQCSALADLAKKYDVHIIPYLLVDRTCYSACSFSLVLNRYIGSFSYENETRFMARNFMHLLNETSLIMEKLGSFMCNIFEIKNTTPPAHKVRDFLFYIKCKH